MKGAVGYCTLLTTGLANKIAKDVFPVISLPSIIQSDNGKEFVNKVIDDIVSTCGRPHYQQSQGLVEQAHCTLDRMIIAKVVECGKQSPPSWTEWLLYNIFKVTHTYILLCSACKYQMFSDTKNPQVNNSTKQTPYELVFGQPPQSLVVPHVGFRRLLDEDLLTQQKKMDNDNDSGK